MKLVVFQIATDQLEKMGEFYSQVLNTDPVSSSPDNGIWFKVGEVRLGITTHDQVNGPNQTPARILFDFWVDDARTECARIKALGTTVIQEPYDLADEEGGTFTLGTFADPDGNYFQIVTF